MPAYTSPDVRNLSVGTGFIEFKPEGAGAYVHLGNIPNFEFKLKTRTLDHYAPVEGMRVKDYTWTIELEAEIEMVMEEITAQNLKLLLLGDITVVDGVTTVDISARQGLVGALKYTATNEVGPRWMIDLFAVRFNGDGDYDPLTTRRNDFNNISVKGSAFAIAGSFGTMTLL